MLPFLECRQYNGLSVWRVSGRGFRVSVVSVCRNTCQPSPQSPPSTTPRPKPLSRAFALRRCVRSLTCWAELLVTSMPLPWDRAGLTGSAGHVLGRANFRTAARRRKPCCEYIRPAGAPCSLETVISNRAERHPVSQGGSVAMVAIATVPTAREALKAGGVERSRALVQELVRHCLSLSFTVFHSPGAGKTLYCTASGPAGDAGWDGGAGEGVRPATGDAGIGRVGRG